MGEIMMTAVRAADRLTTRRPWLAGVTCYADGTAVWAVATVVTFAGLVLGNDVVAPQSASFLDLFGNIDGGYYRDIAGHGYRYAPGVPSTVAFFPAFPIAGRLVARATGWPVMAALVGCANGLGLVAVWLAWAYLRRRAGAIMLTNPDDLSRPRDASADRFAVLAMCLAPTAFYFHLAYSETTLLCAELAVLLLIARRAPVWLVAAVAGLGTAARPVGVSLAVPTAVYLWDRSATPRQFAGRAVLFLPIACWGLLAYMGFQQARFGNPLAFALTQADFRLRPAASLGERLLALLSWEPIRQAYDRGSPAFWQSVHFLRTPVFSLDFANPLVFVATVLLVGLGAWTRWLTRYELAVAVPLLGVPYVTRGYEMQMCSQARFAAVVFPASVVLGRLLSRLPPATGTAVLALSTFMMGVYAALYAAGYQLL